MTGQSACPISDHMRKPQGLLWKCFVPCLYDTFARLQSSQKVHQWWLSGFLLVRERSLRCTENEVFHVVFHVNRVCSPCFVVSGNRGVLVYPITLNLLVDSSLILGRLSVTMFLLVVDESYGYRWAPLNHTKPINLASPGGLSHASMITLIGQSLRLKEGQMFSIHFPLADSNEASPNDCVMWRTHCHTSQVSCSCRRNLVDCVIDG